MDPVGVLNAPPPPAPAPQAPQQPVTQPPSATSAPSAPAPTVAPVSSDTLIDIGGGVRMPARDVIAGYQAAVELRLHDNDNRTFLSVVHRAAQGDEAALQQLASIRGAQGTATIPPAPTGSPTGAAAAPAGQPRSGATDLATALQKMIEPLASKVNAMFGVHEQTVKEKEISSLKTFFQTKKDEFPACAEIEAAAARVYERWMDVKRQSPVRATPQELDRIMREEEAYLGAARPTGTPQQTTEVIRMNEPQTRIPGVAVPGRAAPTSMSPGSTVPTAAPVSTNVPAAGAPSGAPGQVANPNQPMTMESLSGDIERQVNAMGIRTR